MTIISKRAWWWVEAPDHSPSPKQEKRDVSAWRRIEALDHSPSPKQEKKVLRAWWWIEALDHPPSTEWKKRVISRIPKFSRIPLIKDSVNSPEKSVNSPEKSIDLNNHLREIGLLTQGLSFKKSELGKHFQKHPIGKTATEYLNAARKNIMKAIFQNGFVIRTDRTDQATFITTYKNGWLKMKTVLGVFKGKGKLVTFYPARIKSLYSTTLYFKGLITYIAFFSNGISKEGWQTLTFKPGCEGILTPGAPKENLNSVINFLS